MYVVILSYIKPLEEIDRLMKPHVGFLEECYAAGVFLASGRQVPRTGGVILATSPTREDLQTVMQHEFRTSLHHPALAPFADERTRTARRVPG